MGAFPTLPPLNLRAETVATAGTSDGRPFTRMPVVKVRVKDGAPPCSLVFPRRVQLEGGGHSWAWDEV